MKLSNPDGYFYLLYLKSCAKFFSGVGVVFGTLMAFICYKTNQDLMNQERGRVDLTSFQMVSLPVTLHSPKVYYLALAFTFMISAVAYAMLYDFCSVMSKFEFQPD